MNRPQDSHQHGASWLQESNGGVVVWEETVERQHDDEGKRKRAQAEGNGRVQWGRKRGEGQTVG